MQITIVAVGSRGDLQPCVALGLGLQEAGHRVRLATHRPYAAFVRQRGLDFAPLPGNPQDLLLSQAGQDMLQSGRNPIDFVRSLARMTGSILEQAGEETLSACADAEAVFFTTLAFSVPHIAEAQAIPVFSIPLQPIARTREFPSIAWPFHVDLGAWFNLLTHRLSEQLIWQPFRKETNRWRQERLGLDPLPFWGAFDRFYANGTPMLCGFSPTVVARPADWGAHIHVTGYWFLERPQTWRPSSPLLDFLADGTPPVYVGFGSMNNRDAERTTDLVLKALERAGQRGLLLTGWGGLSQTDLPDSVYKVDSVPHDWLFPRMAAVVHHGGAGTTAAGLRAGTPSLLIPFFGDQFFWGRRVAKLGVGPKPLARRWLSARRLAAAINRAVNDERIRYRAAAVGRQIRQEDGVANAVAAFHREMGL